MTTIDGHVPSDASEITTGQANRVWRIDNAVVPYVLKRYGDPARAANEAATLRLLAAHRVPAPRLLAVDSAPRPGWTAQSTVHPDPVPADRLLDELAEPLAAIHQIPGPHIGRLAGAPSSPSWSHYLHQRLTAYVAAAPYLAAEAMALHDQLDTTDLDIQPRLLHHDLQPGHLVVQADGTRLLLDWELAAFGDPLSDLARLAVRLHLEDPTPVVALTDQVTPSIQRRLTLYWRIHLLADTALTTSPPTGRAK
jgi:aminoglycoside phosphotransferase (APT) family kinase protein